MNYGIIFEGDISPLAEELSEKLNELGLCFETGNILTEEVLTALNTYRTANSIAELDFCDPAILRTLGINSDGDEIITLAKYGEVNAKNEVECYDLCSEIVNESRSLGITVTEAVNRREIICAPTAKVSSAAVTAAVLALINQ